VRTSRFVVQLHDATRLHYDLRILIGGVLRSWAVPKGPSLDPAVRRLAVPVEDHEISAGDFEGVHERTPEDSAQVQGAAGAGGSQPGRPDRAGRPRRGTGAVIIWDEGPAEIVRDEPGHLSVLLDGAKLSGGFALTRTGENSWILVKVRDEQAQPGSDVTADQPRSVRSGRTWEDLAGS
jgi:hypothetical protein